MDLWWGRASQTWWVHHPTLSLVTCPDAAWGGKSWTHETTQSAAVARFQENESSWTPPTVDFQAWFNQVVDLEIEVLRLRRLNAVKFQKRKGIQGK